MSNYVLEVENLNHDYPQGAGVLRDITFRIKSGEFVALIGQNGAGKTTLVKHFNGLLQPSNGRVLVQGRDVAGQRVSELARHVGFLFQNPDHQIFCDNVAEEVAFGPVNMGLQPEEVKARVAMALEAVGLAAFSQSSPQNLSKGQRQRLALASVLAMRTDIIVFDEPTTGQDYRESLKIMDLVAELNKQGHTVLFITHDMTLVAAYAKRVLVLGQGRLLVDAPVAKVFGRTQELSQTFVRPPQIVELAQALGLRETVLTPADLALALESGGVADGCCG